MLPSITPCVAGRDARILNRIAAQSPPAIPWCFSGKTVLHGGITNGAAWLQAEISQNAHNTSTHAHAHKRSYNASPIRAKRRKKSAIILHQHYHMQFWKIGKSQNKTSTLAQSLALYSKIANRMNFQHFFATFINNASKKRQQKFGSLHTIVNCMIPLNYLIILPQKAPFVKRKKVYIA